MTALQAAFITSLMAAVIASAIAAILYATTRLHQDDDTPEEPWWPWW